MRRRKIQDTGEASTYWLSVGDLMASILIIFILIFAYQVLKVNERVKKIENYEKFEKDMELFEELQEAVKEKTTIKNKVIEKLQMKFKEENLKIDINPSTGAIKFDAEILFDLNESKLKPKGQEELRKFIPVYTKLLLQDSDIKDEISQIIIEGHTDNKGSYIYNLGLSQERALNVAKFIFTEITDIPNKELLEKYITANGRSYVNTIIEDEKVNEEKSRRVEFQFKLKDEESLREIQTQLEKTLDIIKNKK